MKAILGKVDVPKFTAKNGTQIYLTFIKIEGLEGESNVNEMVMRSFKPEGDKKGIKAFIAAINDGTLVPYRKYQDTPFYHYQDLDINGQYCQIAFKNTKDPDAETWTYNY